MQGGTFTITNLGGIGGTAFTPIVNYPEAAILGMSRTQTQLKLVDGKLVERLMLPLVALLRSPHRQRCRRSPLRRQAVGHPVRSASKLLIEMLSGTPAGQSVVRMSRVEFGPQNSSGDRVSDP